MLHQTLVEIQNHRTRKKERRIANVVLTENFLDVLELSVLGSTGPIPGVSPPPPYTGVVPPNGGEGTFIVVGVLVPGPPGGAIPPAVLQISTINH